MTFEELLAQRRVAKEPADADEIAALRALARRSLSDSALGAMSVDGRFERAYSAARALATVIVRASGYRVRQPGGHYNTFLALEAADPAVFSKYAAYFDVCRGLRNELTYDAAEVVTETELDEILVRVPEFEGVVREWLAKEHPELM